MLARLVRKRSEGARLVACLVVLAGCAPLPRDLPEAPTGAPSPAPRTWMCDPHLAGPVGGPAPTPSADQMGWGLSWCRGVAELRVRAPEEVTAGESVQVAAWILSEAREELPVEWAVELLQTVIGHEDRVLAHREYPVVRVPPGGQDRRQLELAVPAALDRDGSYYLVVSTGLLLPRGQPQEPLRSVSPLRLTSASDKAPMPHANDGGSACQRAS